MKRRRHFLWSVLIILAYSAWTVTSASAHALLLRSTPVANAVLQQPPVQVEIYFSEALETNLSSIQVFDSNNLQVDTGDARVDPADPTRLTVSLHRLADGVYTVTWKAVSAIDGHQTLGTFPFAVGDANASAVSAISQSTSFRLPFSTLLSKFLMLAALALLVGQRLFTALVWNPALRADPSDAFMEKPAAWVVLYRLGMILLLTSLGLGILGQAGQSTGSELAFPWSSAMGSLLTETRLGVIWLVRLALAMLVVWLAGRKESSVRDWSAFAANLGLLFTITLTSHAATEVRPSLPILADWAHLIGMTFWFGGLVYFFTAIRHIHGLDSQARARVSSLLTSQFSLYALMFVGLIGLSGVYSAYLRVGTIPALLDTLYGHVLIVKQVFVAGLLVIAATNLLIISPRLKRDRIQGVATVGLVEFFGKLLAIELTFAAFLLASVSFLTYLPPAKVVSPAAKTFTHTQQVDDLELELNISPAHVGDNTFMLMLMSKDGQPVANAKKVLLRFTPSQANIPASELQMIGDGTGMYMAQGTYLSLPGKWQVQAVVRREDKFDAFGNFDLNLQTPGVGNKNNASAKTNGSLLLLLGLLLAMLSLMMRSYRSVRFGLGLPLAIVIVGLGAFSITRPIPVELPQSNPIPANQESVKAGENLYVVTCAPCHGLSGKGDGAVGLTLNPRPADLTQHAIPGVHTDAQLFEWITNGFPGSRMPAFKSSLSDTDRWNLVNFMRTLAP